MEKLDSTSAGNADKPKPESKGLNPWLAFGLIAGGAYFLLRSARAASPVWRKIDFAKDRLLLVGDSLAVGLGAKLAEEGAEVANRTVAKSGAQITAFVGNGGMVSALEQAIAEFNPTVILVSLGTNDEAVRKSKPEMDVAAAKAQQVDELLKRFVGYHTIWIGPPSFKAWPMDRKFRDMLMMKVGPENYFPTETAFNDDRANDGIHFTTRGYGKWLKSIGHWIRNQNNRYA